MIEMVILWSPIFKTNFETLIQNDGMVILWNSNLKINSVMSWGAQLDKPNKQANLRTQPSEQMLKPPTWCGLEVPI